MPRVYVLSGPDLGRNFEVAEGALFGRTAECAVHLRDASVSRAHARLERGAAGWRVVDVGSRNGLYVGEQRVPAADLGDGDEFRLGEVLLRFRGDVAAPAEALPPEPAAAPAPEIRFHARGVAPAQPADEPAEIELEGDWSAPAPGAAPPPRPASPTPAPAPSAAPRAELAPRPGGTARAAPRSIAGDERARKLAAAGVASSARAGAADARGVLQFHKLEQQEGVLRQEFGQQPLWLRLAIVVVATAVVVGLAWLGYQIATASKARLAPAESVEDGAR